MLQFSRQLLGLALAGAPDCNRGHIPGVRVFAGIFSVFSIVSCAQMTSLSSNGTKTVTWTANRESAVNATGGGYRVYYSATNGFDPSTATYVDVTYNGATTPTSVALSNLLEVTTYVRVAAFGKDATGTTNFGTPSAQVSFTPSTGGGVTQASAKALSRTPASEAESAESQNSLTSSSASSQFQASSKLTHILAPGKKAIAAQHKLVHYDRDHYVGDEILITYKKGVSSSSVQSSVSQMGACASEKVLADAVSDLPIQRVKLASVMSVQSAVEAALLNPDVASAQPNFIYHKYAVPNDTNYARQWDLKNTGQTVVSLGADAASNSDASNPGTSGADMNIESAWDINTDCSSHVVAVIDSGVNYTHSDLASNMWTGVTNGSKDFVDTVSGTGKGMEGHGTHVAGTIGAIGNNGTGMAGVCWTAQIMNVRVLGNDGSGTTSAVVQGINYARTNGANIINMSLGGSGYDATLDAAVSAASDAGMVIAVAAGNDSSNNDSSADYPCNFPYAGVVCVAALNQNNGLADYSNYGATSVDIGAPGTNVTSLWNGTATDYVVSPTSFSNLSAGGWNTSTNTTYNRQMVAIPANWNGTTAKYSASSTAYTFYTTTFPTADYLTFNFFSSYSLAASDNIKFNYKVGSTTPFTGGTTVSTYTGNTGGGYEFDSFDITPCAGGACAVGLQLNSTAGSTLGTGMWVISPYYTSLVLNNTSFDTISGTSMATPHVAGLAALVWQVNPNYTASDVILAMMSSGKSLSALSGKTVSGKGINAAAAVRFIAPPTSVAVSN